MALKIKIRTLAYVKKSVYLCKTLKNSQNLHDLKLYPMKDRIKLIMEDKKMTQQTFASFLKLSTASLSSIFNGRTNPTLKMVESIKKSIPNININWLLFGEGEMYENEKNTDSPLLKSQEKRPDGLLNFDPTLQQEKPNNLIQNQGSSSKILNVNKDENKIDNQTRKITEIRVFFDDLTYESFLPNK